MMKSSQVQSIMRGTRVWDMTYPWSFQKNDAEIFPRYREAGFSLISATTMGDVSTISDAYANIALLRARVLASPDKFRLVERIEDIASAKTAGQLAVIRNAQGTAWIGSDLGHLEPMYRLGLRHMPYSWSVAFFACVECKNRCLFVGQA